MTPSSLTFEKIIPAVRWRGNRKEPEMGVGRSIQEDSGIAGLGGSLDRGEVEGFMSSLNPKVGRLCWIRYGK